MASDSVVSPAASPAAASQDAHSELPDGVDASVTGLKKETMDKMNEIVRYLSDHRDENGYDVSAVFQRMPNKRTVPDYFEVIKQPTAFSTIRNKLIRKRYTTVTEFVLDFALIFHNAQVYNRPSSGVYQDALKLKDLFLIELKKLVNEEIITIEEAELPDLGEIPPVDPSPPPGPDDEEVEEDDEDDDEDDEEEDSDDDGPRRRSKKKSRRRSEVPVKRRGSKADEDNKEDPDAQKKRGRPPKVHTPMEARINTLLKGLRKFKNSDNSLKIIHFERLPDKAQMPEYYLEIQNPIAMDLIKRKAKRKKYPTVNEALRDLDLMFNNAKAYNLEDSQVYQDAVDLQREAHVIAEQEKKKPDSDFVDEDGRLPLSEILHNGDKWKVGDWVHLANPNDVTKPIVAQVYRTWQDSEGQKWINACWYYRPEQTVHRFEKHFFENEVVKTGQYRDHHIEEVVDRCFVMFFTRFNKGRPRGFPPDKEVYVCEARYNEEKFKLNKIKTWASCVPDEVREKDYEMDLFDAPRKMKKVPSPIKHLLREDATEDDPLPKPTWGAANAPPIVGAVHKRPRELNESPPPEPTPSPPPTPEPIRRPPTNERSRFDSQGDIIMSGSQPAVAPATISRSLSGRTLGQNSYGQQFPAVRPSPSPVPLTQPNSYGPTTPAATHPMLNHGATYQPQTYNQYPPTAITPAPQPMTPATNYMNYQPRANAGMMPTGGNHSNAYNPPRPIEVYTLPDAANAAIPPQVRDQFQQDDQGRVLWFTTPPVDANRLPDDCPPHSLAYLADKARAQTAEEEQRKARTAELEVLATQRLQALKRNKGKYDSFMREQRLKTVTNWVEKYEKGTDYLYQQLHGENWETMREHDKQKVIKNIEKAKEDKARREALVEAARKRKEVPLTGWKIFP